MVLDAIAGPDSKDSTCIPAGSSGGPGESFASALGGPCAQGTSGGVTGSLEGITVGIPREFNVKELGKMWKGQVGNVNGKRAGGRCRYRWKGWGAG